MERELEVKEEPVVHLTPTQIEDSKSVDQDSEDYENEEESEEIQKERYRIQVPTGEAKLWQDYERKALNARMERDLCRGMHCELF